MNLIQTTLSQAVEEVAVPSLPVAAVEREAQTGIGVHYVSEGVVGNGNPVVLALQLRAAQESYVLLNGHCFHHCCVLQVSSGSRLLPRTDLGVLQFLYVVRAPSVVSASTLATLL